MDKTGKFIQEEDAKMDTWKNVAMSDRLVKKCVGEAFADTRLDDGLHAIVDKDTTTEEKEWAKQQKTVGAIAHLTLQAMEGYSVLYRWLSELVITGIGQPNTNNPKWTGEDDTVHNKYIFSEWQNQYYEYFQSIQNK